MLFCKFCEIVKNIIFTERIRTPASAFMEHICNMNEIEYHIT